MLNNRLGHLPSQESNNTEYFFWLLDDKESHRVTLQNGVYFCSKMTLKFEFTVNNSYLELKMMSNS